MENSPDEMARLVSGACVTDSQGLYDKMQHTVKNPKGMERRVDIECPALKTGLETSSTKFFFGVHGGAQLGNSLTKHTETEPFASLRNGLRWRVIFDTRFMSSKKRGAAGISTLEKPSEEDLNMEGPSRDGATHVCVHCTRTSTEHLEHIRHSSRLSSLTHFFLQKWAGSFSGLE